jgi:hypothetical protein
MLNVVALARRVRVGCSTALELMRTLWNGPYWWLVPVMCVLLPAAVVFILLQTVPIVAPFVYTLF